MSNQQGSQEGLGGVEVTIAAMDDERFAHRKMSQQDQAYDTVRREYDNKVSIASSSDTPLSSRVRNALEAIKLAYEVGPTGATLLTDDDLTAARELHATLKEMHAEAQGNPVSGGVSVS